MGFKSDLFKKGIFFSSMFIILLIFGGTAAAQHEGGLGESKVHLNLAAEYQLLSIDGMTEELAEAIVEYRDNSGFFKTPEDLLKVPGMTRNTFETMDPQLGTEGDLYCIPMEGFEEDEFEDIPLAPSKC